MVLETHDNHSQEWICSGLPHFSVIVVIESMLKYSLCGRFSGLGTYLSYGIFAYCLLALTPSVRAELKQTEKASGLINICRMYYLYGLELKNIFSVLKSYLNWKHFQNIFIMHLHRFTQDTALKVHMM